MNFFLFVYKKTNNMTFLSQRYTSKQKHKTASYFYWNKLLFYKKTNITRPGTEQTDAHCAILVQVRVDSLRHRHVVHFRGFFGVGGREVYFKDEQGVAERCVVRTSNHRWHQILLKLFRNLLVWKYMNERLSRATIHLQ